ncbi:MAG TPA: c-type cytochrome [Terracidiphilus sp.]|nr:c-type cytochrome [Terracidiphilus sp.]
MKSKSPLPLVAALLLTAAFAVTAVAQAPNPPAAAAEHHFPPMPPPKNLQVLPKTLTSEQVHDIMHHWAEALGTECSHCHAVDTKAPAFHGHPRLNFADDSKPEKRTARLMFKMVQDINDNYISMVQNSGLPVSCGTCHRGQTDPPPFVPPPDHDHDHHGPPPPAAAMPMPK